MSLAQLALSYAQAGADCVAPSDMMDGRVRAIRTALDQNHLERTLLMSYSAKFHSKFYGPFRIAADAAPKGGTFLKDRATYQIDPAHSQDAVTSSWRDAQEGADILMVKPGMPYLDMLYRLAKEIPKPWAVYQVSGEYASIELMAEKGLINGPAAHVEAWTAFVRAGASIIISYGARYATQYLRRSEMKPTQESEKLFARSKTVVPGGVHSPVRAFRGVGGTPRFMTTAAGAEIEDVDQNKYVDYCMSWGPLIFGHQDPEIREAIHAALRRGWTYGTA